MKYKLLSVRGMQETNIGDYIQALASSQFLPHVDGFIDREKLKDYNDEECAVIMNGWYIHNQCQWPPSDKIHPLYVAVHFNTLANDALYSAESVAYLKKFVPIGCRDIQTCQALTEKGIDAYFSGCMTLTLGEKYAAKERNEKVFFVDPYFITHWNLSNIIKSAWHLLCHYKDISTISQKYPENKTGLRKKMILSIFHKEYSKIFSEDTLRNAEYICQQNSYYETAFRTDSERMKEAERLVELYAKASLVVTSRIHCALPCLGLETPVIFTENSSQRIESSCRLGGLRELFNIIVWKNDHLVPEFHISGKITKDNKPYNKSNWKILAETLKTRVHNWLNNENI